MERACARRRAANVAGITRLKSVKLLSSPVAQPVAPVGAAHTASRATRARSHAPPRPSSILLQRQAAVQLCWWSSLLLAVGPQQLVRITWTCLPTKLARKQAQGSPPKLPRPQYHASEQIGLPHPRETVRKGTS